MMKKEKNKEIILVKVLSKEFYDELLKTFSELDSRFKEKMKHNRFTVIWHDGKKIFFERGK